MAEEVKKRGKGNENSGRKFDQKMKSILEYFLQVPDKIIVHVFVKLCYWHVGIEVFKELRVALPIVVDRSFS